jgi:hypothetical protein
MEHPLLPSLDNLTLEELGSKISELNKKLQISHRMGNAYLCHQIALALETYTAKQQEKLKELYKPSNGNNDFDDKIDIS